MQGSFTASYAGEQSCTKPFRARPCAGASRTYSRTQFSHVNRRMCIRMVRVWLSTALFASWAFRHQFCHPSRSECMTAHKCCSKILGGGRRSGSRNDRCRGQEGVSFVLHSANCILGSRFALHPPSSKFEPSWIPTRLTACIWGPRGAGVNGGVRCQISNRDTIWRTSCG